MKQPKQFVSLEEHQSVIDDLKSEINDLRQELSEIEKNVSNNKSSIDHIWNTSIKKEDLVPLKNIVLAKPPWPRITHTNNDFISRHVTKHGYEIEDTIGFVIRENYDK